jgi:ATP-binding cassette, subfamily B, bacterial PglK
MIGEITRRFRALTPAQQRRWAMMAPLGLATALLEGLGGIVVFALLAVLFDPVTTAEGQAVALIRSFLPESTTSATVVGLAAIIAGIHIVKNVLVAALTWWRARAVELDTATLSTRLLQGYVNAPWTFHLQRSSAAVMEALIGSTRAYFDVLESTSTIITEAAVILALGIVALSVAPAGVSVTAVCIALLLLMVGRFARVAQRRGGEQSAELGAALYGHVQHSLGALKELIILGRSQYFVNAFERDAHVSAHLHMRRAVLNAVPRLLIESAFVLGMLALIAVASLNGSTASVLPLVSLYAYAGFRVIPAVHRIAIQVNALRWTIGASATVLDDLERTRSLLPQPVAGERMVFDRELKAEGVSFTYEGAHGPVLSNINFSIGHGESVAIVGATGAGKTTLVDVLIGLLPPAAGQVTVDGQRIDTDVAAWQKNIGYVPQMPFLVDDTLRRNIALGIPDEQIEDSAVARAVTLARLDETVEKLPQGLATRIGEIGVRLSGGERQRVSIARALYRDPSLLVFDEATSSLDPRTERDIAEAIEPLRGERTILIIAHRMTTVARCDRILLLREGRIEATGTYRELVDSSPAFRAVAAL